MREMANAAASCAKNYGDRDTTTALNKSRFRSSMALWSKVDTWLRDQKVPSSSPGYARSTLRPWERLFTCISSPHSCVKRVPDYIICNDSSSVMLLRELRKVRWLEWPVGDPCKALRALFVDKRYINTLFDLI